MDKINIIITKDNNPTSTNKSKPTSKNKDNKYKYDCDYLYDELHDLVNDNWKAWYTKRFYELGKDKVLEIASIARADGKQPDRLFSKLIKEGC